jgi:ribonuclease HI
MVNKYWNIWIDGGSAPNPGIGAAGIVALSDDNDEFTWSVNFGSDKTNNQSEILAFKEALLFGLAFKATALIIHGDSQYVEGIFFKHNKAKANQLLIAEVTGLMNVLHRTCSLSFVKVLGHSDNKQNALCDRLCSNAINGIIVDTRPESPAKTENIQKYIGYAVNELKADVNDGCVCKKCGDYLRRDEMAFGICINCQVKR